MPYPLKFKHLLELKNGDIPVPNYVWLMYVVCGLEQDSCGWQGWVLESAFQIDETKSWPTSTGDALLPYGEELICPNCGRNMFGTAVKVRMNLSKDQTPPLIEGIHYFTSPLEYSDE